MFRFRFLIILYTIGLSLYVSRVSSQTSTETRGIVEKFIRAKDEVAFNSNGSHIGIKYSDITGSPYWKNDYTVASLYKGGRMTGKAPVKINLFTNEIYFLRGQEELVLEGQEIDRIVFSKAEDTTTFIRHVPNLFLNKKRVDGFVQVMNSGQYQLLKYIKKDLLQADSALSYKRYFFSESNYYFIMKQQKVERIKKLNRENLLIYLPLSSKLKSWINKNNLDFKKEADVILFLNYYNSTLEKAN